MNILITGISRGIGKELLDQAIDSGKFTKVFACSSSGNLPENTDIVRYFHLNFCDDESIHALSNALQGEALSILINNAGYLKHESFDKMDISDAKKIFDINFWGPYKLVKALLGNLRQGKGHVVNIGSMGGFQGSGKFPGLATYSASKAAVANLTECLAEEYKEDEIKFNCLALGAVNTEMLKKAFPSYDGGVEAGKTAKYILHFALYSSEVINGKVLPISVSTP